MRSLCSSTAASVCLLLLLFFCLLPAPSSELTCSPRPSSSPKSKSQVPVPINPPVSCRPRPRPRPDPGKPFVHAHPAHSPLEARLIERFPLLRTFDSLCCLLCCCSYSSTTSLRLILLPFLKEYATTQASVEERKEKRTRYTDRPARRSEVRRSTSLFERHYRFPAQGSWRCSSTRTQSLLFRSSDLKDK